MYMLVSIVLAISSCGLKRAIALEDVLSDSEQIDNSVQDVFKEKIMPAYSYRQSDMSQREGSL